MNRSVHFGLWLKGGLAVLGLSLLSSHALAASELGGSSAVVVVEQQRKSLTGLVKDATGEPIIGATVVVAGTTRGVMTNVDGGYTLSVPSGESISLKVGYLGYKSQTIVVAAETTKLDVVLESDNVAIDEVVIVGYGTQKKANLTGAVASVASKDIQSRAQTNVVSSLQGLAPGVTVINRPGEAPSVNFRGRGNLGASDPLYVVDGVIVDAAFFGSLDPNTIEGISFLKDAASSSIYGSRAAYGVVLVQTQKGKAGQVRVSYNGFVGAKMNNYLPQIVDSWDYAELWNEARYNSNPALGKNQAYSEAEIAKFRDGSDPNLYPNSQWYDLVYKNMAVTTQHSVTFTGGSEKFSFFGGVGYMYDEGQMQSRDNQRYNIDLSVKGEMTKWLTLRAGAKYIHSVNKIDGGTPTSRNLLIAPSTFVGQHTNGEYGSVAGGRPAESNFINENPMRILSYNDWTRNQNSNALYEIAMDIKPVAGLVITGQAALKVYDYKKKNFQATRPDVPSYLNPGTIMSGSGDTRNYMYMDFGGSTQETYQATANYTFEKGIHSFSALAGASYERFNNQWLKAQRDGFPTNSMTDMSGGANSGPNYQNSSESYTHSMISYFARVNYSIAGKYLLEANFRADGSSRFHADNRWGYFPSVSAGWRISEEKWMASANSWLNNLKLRASYGSLGNINNVGYYDYFANYSSAGNYPWGNTMGNSIGEDKPANSGLSWETLTMTNVGLDFDLWGGKLSGTVEYYIKNTDNILLSYPVAKETGISTNPSQNLGQVQNTGIEVALSHRNTVGDFTYSIGANMAYNQNKITKLNVPEIVSNVGQGVAKFIQREGESIGSFYGLRSNGLYTQAEIDAKQYYTYGGVTPNAGDTKFVPMRNIKYGEEISSADRVILGKDVPDYTYGVNMSFAWKGLELSLYGQGVVGTSVAFEVYDVHPFFHGADNPRQYHMKRWTVENPNPSAVYPRIYTATDIHTTYNRTFNDYQVFNADYFRLKTITLAYSLPRPVVTKMGLQNLRFYLTGENLLTLRADDKMGDFDPESPSGFTNNFGVKTVAFGVNVSF